MKKMYLALALLAIVSLSLLAQPSFAYHYSPSQLPIKEYDYHTPYAHVSPVAMSLGGVNITNGCDIFGGYDNPALLYKNQKMYFAVSARQSSEKTMNFKDMLEYSNLLKDTRLSYVGISAKTFAFSYQILAESNFYYRSSLEEKQEYYDYKLDAFQTSFALLDKKVPNGSLGFGVKYLFGRLIHKVTYAEPDVEHRNTFLDEKAKGFSFDVGGLYKMGRMTFAASLLDVYSQLYWEHYDTERLTRNWALGTQYDLENVQFMYTLKGKLEDDTKVTNHMGLNFTPYTSAAENNPESMGLRVGTFWEYVVQEDGSEEKVVNYTMGAGYNMSGIKLDFGLVSPDFDWESNDYLISVTFAF